MRAGPRTSLWVRIAVTLVTGVAISVAAYWLSDLINGTALVARGATCLDEGCFCETDADSFPVQVANAFSSLLFVFLGVWALLAGDRQGTGTRERRLMPYFAVTMLFLGMSSFFYHGTLSFLGQYLDIFSMYAFGILVSIGALYRSGRISGRNAALAFLAASVLLGALQYGFPDSRRILFLLVLLPGLVLETLPVVTGHSPKSPHVRHIWTGIGLLLVAFVVWSLDQFRIVCDPRSLIQGHAIWHLLTAIAAFLVFAHYRRTAHPA